jgi:hypothetical protein
MPDRITVTLERRILEHPRALHVRRMRAAVWLYLGLLSRLPQGSDTLEVEPRTLASAMGLPEGTIRSWLGHLRKGRYVELVRLNGGVRVRVKRVPPPDPAKRQDPQRFFTPAKLMHSLDETEGRKLLEDALEAYGDDVIRRALAGALAVPAGQIRKSRTALFLYLLKRHAHETPEDDPRP